MQLFDLFVMPWPNSKETLFRWGFGPYFVFPTSTSNLTGNGAWEMGPAAAFSYRAIPAEYCGVAAAGYVVCIYLVASRPRLGSHNSANSKLPVGTRLVREIR